MRTARRRWVLQNLAVPMLPWALGVVVAMLWFQNTEWQFLGINIYAITITLIALSTASTIARVNEIVPEEFDNNEIFSRYLLWTVGGLLFTVFFTVYDVWTLENRIHRWYLGRTMDLVILCFGLLVLVRAYLACRYLKLDARS
jgi:hypothetical protein